MELIKELIMIIIRLNQTNLKWKLFNKKNRKNIIKQDKNWAMINKYSQNISLETKYFMNHIRIFKYEGASC